MRGTVPPPTPRCAALYSVQRGFPRRLGPFRDSLRALEVNRKFRFRLGALTGQHPELLKPNALFWPPFIYSGRGTQIRDGKRKNFYFFVFFEKTKHGQIKKHFARLHAKRQCEWFLTESAIPAITVSGYGTVFSIYIYLCNRYITFGNGFSIS